MRRPIATLATALLTFAAPDLAFAEDEERRPESSESSDTGTSGSSAFKRKGALLDASPQTRHQMISFFAFVPYSWGIGIGGAARYAIPIVPEGFIGRLNDSVEVELGADIWAATYFGVSYVGLAAPIAEGRWTFYLTDQWSVYGKVGFGWSFGLGSYTGATPWAGFYWLAGPGALYKFGDGMYARAEIGSGGLRVGIGIEL